MRNGPLGTLCYVKLTHLYGSILVADEIFFFDSVSAQRQTVEAPEKSKQHTNQKQQEN